MRTARPTSREARSAARLAAVQALYQMDLARTDLNAVIHEFTAVRAEPAGETADGETIVFDEDEQGARVIADADRAFFAEILRGVVRLQASIDRAVDQQLASGWRLARVDSIVRQILRAALYELIDRTDVPARVVINEYIQIAKAFFDGDEPRVVNGVLDQLARKHRVGEFGPPAAAAQAPPKGDDPSSAT